MIKQKFSIILIAAIILVLLYHPPVTSIKNLELDVFSVKHDYSELEVPNTIKIRPQVTPKAIITPKPASAPKAKTTPAPTGFYGSLIAEIKEYLSQQEGSYGVYFVDLTSGQRFGINENKTFVAASTIKVPISLYLYNRAVSKKINLNTMLMYEECDYEEGTGGIQYEELGTEYSLRDLSKLSIIHSDNVAVNMLIRYLEYENILKYMDGLVKRTVARDNNLTTPKDMAVYLKTLLDLSQKNKLYKELLDYMLNTEYNDRIPLYLPPEVLVAHKIGSQVRAVHDVGIVFAEKPYILCIYSDDVDESAAPYVLADVSKRIYDFTQR